MRTTWHGYAVAPVGSLALFFLSHACGGGGSECPRGMGIGCYEFSDDCFECIHIICADVDRDCSLFPNDDGPQPFLDCVCRSDVCGSVCKQSCNGESVSNPDDVLFGVEDCVVCATQASEAQCKDVPCLTCG
jgi:hypothetical protein